MGQLIPVFKIQIFTIHEDHVDDGDAQVWSHEGAGQYAENCALMSGFGNEAEDSNVISGPKIC